MARPAARRDGRFYRLVGGIPGQVAPGQ